MTQLTPAFTRAHVKETASENHQTDDTRRISSDNALPLS
jgi:hypothetical protein